MRSASRSAAAPRHSEHKLPGLASDLPASRPPSVFDLLAARNGGYAKTTNATTKKIIARKVADFHFSAAPNELKFSAY